MNDKTVFFDAEKYEKCIKYCEKNYYKLFPYQKFIYAFVFMFRDDFPVFKTFFIMMGRGNGKDGAFMPLMNFLQTPLYGIQNYHIDIIANNEEQARDSFNVVYEMLEGQKQKFKTKFAWTKGKIKNKKTRAELRYNTSNAKTKDGKKSGALLFNEYHGYENYDQINVFSSQLGKIPHPRKFIITTQGYVRDGPIDDILSICKKILETGENDVGYFPVIYRLDSKKEIDMPERWIKANPSIEYRQILKQQIMDDYQEMKMIPSKRQEFVTKRMNLPERDEEITVASWNEILYTTYSDIERKIPIEEPDLEGYPAIIGIDYADIRDFVSAGLLFKVEGKYVWRQKTWISRKSPNFENIKFPIGNYGADEYQDFVVVDAIQAEDIVEWCIEMMARYEIRKIVMDTYRFALFRKVFEQYGLSVETRKDPYGMVRMIRYLGSVSTIVAPLVEKAFSDHNINFGRSAIMRWYTNNVKVVKDGNGNRQFKKIEPKLRKTDGFMAFIITLCCEELLEENVLYI